MDEYFTGLVGRHCMFLFSSVPCQLLCFMLFLLTNFDKQHPYVRTYKHNIYWQKDESHTDLNRRQLDWSFPIIWIFEVQRKHFWPHLCLPLSLLFLNLSSLLPLCLFSVFVFLILLLILLFSSHCFNVSLSLCLFISCV